MKKVLFYIVIILMTAGSHIHANTEQYTDNVVTITVTRQGYDYNAPWQKTSVDKETISGVVIEGNRILTISYKLADQVFLEVSKFGSSRKYSAKIIIQDYQSGLSLITVADENFFKDLKPVRFNSDSSIKEGKPQVVRWSSNGIFKVYSADYMKSTIEFFESTGMVLIHHLLCDIDSGGRGEPVFINGKLAGISSWHFEKNKTIKVIDLKVIERMLKDIGNGDYKGMPLFIIEDTALENDENLRAYLGLKEKDTGVLVTDVPPGSSGSDVLKKWDVITNVNGIDIDDNGLYNSKMYGQLNYYGLICLDNFVGDTINMAIIRNKKKIKVRFKLKPYSDNSFLIPPISYDLPPRFYICGGILLQELTVEYLKTWGDEWKSKADKRLMYYYDNYLKYPDSERKRIVVLNTVLPSSVNKGYHELRNLILQKTNNIVVRDLKHVKEIIDSSRDKFIKFDFIGNQSVIFEREEALASIGEIMKSYNIHTPFYLGGD